MDELFADNRKEFVLSKQQVSFGSSAGDLLRVAENAASKADFQHKQAIAQKGCDESIYRLKLLYRTN